MKRYFLYIFACVCALTYATTAQAQTFEDGDIITISDGNGNYLAVNASNAIIDVTDVDESCFWVVTVYNASNNTYYLTSYTRNRYLSIGNSSLTTSSNTGTNTRITYSESTGYLSRGSYYVRYNNGWTVTSNTSRRTTLELKKVQGRFLSASPASGSTVKSLNTITVSGDVAMTSVTGANIQLAGNGQTLTGANGLEVKISEEDLTKLVITVTGSLTAGEYTLTIPKGAVKYNGGDYLAATYNWTLEGPKYVAVAPTSGYIVKSLEKITVTGDMEMTALDLSKIQLAGEGVTLTGEDGLSVTISSTDSKKLVISPTTILEPGDYILTLEAAAVKSGDMPFGEVKYNWTVDPEKSVALMHVYGFYDALDNRGYQKVHTVERTIYYTGEEESIELRLAERNFFGYMRWYDYTTDRNITTSWFDVPTGRNNVEFDELTDGTVHFGWYGLHTTHLQDNDNSNNVPSIRPWNDNKPHTVACDVSSYINYETTTQGENIARIVEPTLSYRQIFYFKPASEIADAIASANSSGKFFEEYNYNAPEGVDILLATEYRYAQLSRTGTDADIKSVHDAELNYFVKNSTGDLLRVGKDVNATWYYTAPGGGTNKFPMTLTTTNSPAKDYLKVEEAGTYELIVAAADLGLDNDIKLAKFVVGFVANAGPSTEGISIKVGEDNLSVASQADIEKNFEIVSYNDFDFGQEYTSENHLKNPLTWEQSTYGFYNPDMSYTDKGNHDPERIPYYGEYAFIHNPDAKNVNWVGNNSDVVVAKDNYSMYVDGTSEPGLVASLHASNVVICAQKLMYCSMWLRNPHNGGNANPTFRCNIQGRNKNANNTYSDWQDIGMFYIGELPTSSGWNQVVFPITSSDAYNEVRVQLYNFGTGGNGNDFMLDDLTLFTDKSEMGGYQMEPTIVSGSNSTSPYTMAVLRVDYKSHSSEDVLYYQIYNLTESGKEPLELNDYLNATGNAISGNAISGSVKVPEGGSIPNNVTPMTVAEFSEFLKSNNSTTGRYFVNIAGEYVMYLVHKIPKPLAPEGSPYPYEPTNYWIRMSYEEVADNAWDNLQTDCTMEMVFTATQSTTFELRNAMTDALLEEFMYQSDNNCANTLYTLDVKITQDTDPENVGGNESGLAYADWLKGIASDEVYAEHVISPNATADAAFAEHYGYTRDQVTAAINDLRSKNKTVADVAALTAADFSNAENKVIIESLCNEGYLVLRAQSVNFYLGAADMARYWVFPIEGTAVSTQGNPLHDTPEPMWVQVSTYASDFSLTIFDYELPDQYTTSLPTVRVLKSKMNEEIIINYAYQGDEDFNDKNQQGDAYLFSTTDMQLSRALGTRVFQYNSVVDNTNHIITLKVPEDVEETFAIGSEYVVAVTLRDDAGNPTPEEGNNGCPVGTWFFNILVVPDVVEWAGAAGDVWGEDANWQGYEEGETVYKFAPIKGSRVVIPAGTAPTLTELSENPMPLHLNYPMTPVCGEIYFENGATIQNQHLLQHDKAIVDLVIPQGTWNSVSVPIAGVVTGDMFIPHVNEGGNYQGYSTENEDPFDVKGFEGTRSSKSAYAFWQSFFNRTVSVLNENPNKNTSSIVSDIETNTTTFAPTNSLFEPLVVGSGHQLKGWGPTNIPEETPLTIRLPKPDNAYSYFYSNGTPGTPEAFERGENAGKLVYNPDQAIMLTGESAETNYVMFGNPTMAYIDMQAFLTANASMLKGAYYTMSSDSWDAATAMVQADESARYLAPMRSVMLELAGGVMPSAAESGISLLPEHLVATLPTAPAAAPRRAASANEVQKMVIRAEVDGLQAQCIVATAYGASDIYSENEDALFFSSGVEAGVNSATATSPVNMYTVSERVPMMVDVRKGIDTIPMAMLVKESSRTETMKLTFTLSAGWDKDVYFCDAETGSKILIVDGMEMEVTLPANHETRYFLEGPDTFDPNGGGDIWSSTDDVQGAINVWAYSQGNGQLTVATNDILKSVEVYDLTGRLIANRALDVQYNSTTIDTPTGACIVKAVLRDNSVHYLSALVK